MRRSRENRVRERTGYVCVFGIFKTKSLKHQMLKEVWMLQKNTHQKAIFSKQKVCFLKKRSMDVAKIKLRKVEAKWKFCKKEVWMLQKKWKQNGNFCSI